MIFFSDLDNTLIFGKRWTLKSNKNDIVGVEKKEELDVSYMTDRSYRLLKELSSNINFIPTTARTIEQYNRIQIFKKSIKVKYAIMTNGGNILIDGEIDRVWNKKIKKKLKEAISYEEGKTSAIKLIGQDKIKKLKNADGIYFYAVLKKEVDLETVNILRSYFIQKGIDVKHVGNKIYFMPLGIDKYEACTYLVDILGERDYYCAGDSIMDENMLLNSTLGFIPASGGLMADINRMSSKDNIQISNKEGIESSEYILQYLLDKLKQMGKDKNF